MTQYDTVISVPSVVSESRPYYSQRRALESSRVHARARRNFSCGKLGERKARERELANLDEKRRALKAER